MTRSGSRGPQVLTFACGLKGKPKPVAPALWLAFVLLVSSVGTGIGRCTKRRHVLRAWESEALHVIAAIVCTQSFETRNHRASPG